MSAVDAGHAEGDADPRAWALEIDAALRHAGTPERAARERAYLKSSIEHYGVTVPAGRALAKRFAPVHPDLTHDELCELTARAREVREPGRHGSSP